MEPSTIVTAISITLLAASEIIALIPQLRSNSVIQVVLAVLLRAFPKK